MLLITFLGIIATLTSVSRGCNIGPHNLKNFDFNKYAGIWYWLLYTPNVIDDDFACPSSTYSKLEGNNSQVIVEVYAYSQQRHLSRTGNLFDIDSNGHWEEYYGEPYDMHVPIYVIAVDYDRYSIVKYCMFQNTKSYTFVLYRSRHPDNATVKEMQKKLKENEIDVNELGEYPMEKCENGNWAAEEVPLRDTGAGN